MAPDSIGHANDSAPLHEDGRPLTGSDAPVRRPDRRGCRKVGDNVFKATSNYGRDFVAGELVDAAEGLGVAAFFGRRNPAVFSGAGTIDLATWKARERETVRSILGAWRLRIEISDLDPTYWTPAFVGP